MLYVCYVMCCGTVGAAMLLYIVMSSHTIPNLSLPLHTQILFTSLHLYMCICVGAAGRGAARQDAL
jgi:hypothetical protein